MTDFFEEAAHISRSEGDRVTNLMDPFETHFVEDLSIRTRSYRAICGAPVHSSEVSQRVDNRDPSCHTCARLRREEDADESEF